jgi:hypothetical protein
LEVARRRLLAIIAGLAGGVILGEAVERGTPIGLKAELETLNAQQSEAGKQVDEAQTTLDEMKQHLPVLKGLNYSAVKREE